MATTASIIWAAYTSAIGSLAGLSGENINPLQRFSPAPQNTFSIPVVPYVNQWYQNFNIYSFASVVPDADIAILTPTGQSYDGAYGLYLDNVFLQVPNDPRVQAEINQTEAKLSNFRQQLETYEAQAENGFFTDCPNGEDPFTGENCTLMSYAAEFYPEIADYTNEIANANAVLKELLNEIVGSFQANTLANWRDAYAEGSTQNQSYPNYNMAVLQANSPTVLGVSGGFIAPHNLPTSFDAGYSLGGDFNDVAKQWITSFPTSYPTSRTQFQAGASSYTSTNMSLSSNSWTQWGYSSNTVSTGSSGWVFWQSGSSSTSTSSVNVVNIAETEFEEGITVSVWGLGVFPVQMGQWYQGNPLRTWPELLEGTPATVSQDVKQQITSAVIGYGVETKFVLSQTAYNQFSAAVSSAQQSSGSLSVFGTLYGKSSSSQTSTYNAWSNIQMNSQTRTITLVAQHAKVPQLLGTIITTIPS